jgi:Fibronectin type III domain
VTPNAVYTGTITIMLSGGGLSTPVVLTFNNSSAAQIFTITPTAVGPVTLAPSNNGSLTNASALTYGTPPAAPTITSVTPGNGQISVALTVNATGGSTITSYSATCGSNAIIGAASPIVVTSLTNGTAYTCTVKATNSNGISAASSASNPATPVAPANSYSFSGPTGGALNTASSNFTVTPNAAYTGTVTVALFGGGLSTLKVFTFSNSSAPQTFTITPTAVGPVSLMPSNSGALANPPALAYATPPAPPFITSVSPGNGQISVTFIPNGSGGSTITSYAATCSSGGAIGSASGSASPITVTGLTNGQPYTCTVTATNAAGTGTPSGASVVVSPLSPATSFTLNGPSGGALNSASAAFTVTPNAEFAGTITITPSGGGLSAPKVLSFSNSSSLQTFTITPGAVGPVTLIPTNSGQLANPPALSYATPPAPPLIGVATAGNGSATLAFTASAQTGGSSVTSYQAVCNPGNIIGPGFSSPLTVNGLANGTAYACTVAAMNAAGTSAASAPSSSFVPGLPGAPQGLSAVSGTNQAVVSFPPRPRLRATP